MRASFIMRDTTGAVQLRRASAPATIPQAAIPRAQKHDTSTA